MTRKPQSTGAEISLLGQVAHPLEKWWLRLHGLMAFAVLVAIGSVLPIQARRAWQLKKNRHTGNQGGCGGWR